MNRLLTLLTVILLLGCDCDNKSQAQGTVSNFHYAEGNVRSSLAPMVYHDESRKTTCWVLWQSAAGTTSESDAIAMTCIPDWQLSPLKEAK